MAEPEVHTRATGFEVCVAIPSATKAAVRSSTTVLIAKFPLRSIDTSNGAFREPGDATALSIP